jgi:hypothetical protein
MLRQSNYRFHQERKVETMKYETPELTALTPAINAIQFLSGKGLWPITETSGGTHNETASAYADWE